jgi:hypothetical protein
MQFRQVDKLLFSILLLLMAAAYLLYYFSNQHAGKRSSKKAKDIFYISSIADTIIYQAPFYGSNCNMSFSIANYSLHDIVVDVCRYPAFRDVQIGDFIQKSKNANECVIKKINGSQIKGNLLIEY